MSMGGARRAREGWGTHVNHFGMKMGENRSSPVVESTGGSGAVSGACALPISQSKVWRKRCGETQEAKRGRLSIGRSWISRECSYVLGTTRWDASIHKRLIANACDTSYRHSPFTVTTPPSTLKPTQTTHSGLDDSNDELLGHQNMSGLVHEVVRGKTNDIAPRSPRIRTQFMSLLDEFLHLSIVESNVPQRSRKYFKLHRKLVSLETWHQYSSSNWRTRTRRRTGIVPLPIETLARIAVSLGNGFISG